MLEVIEHQQSRVANVFLQVFFQDVEGGLLADLANSESLHDGGWD